MEKQSSPQGKKDRSAAGSRRRSKAIAFGRNYYSALGGLEKQKLPCGGDEGASNDSANATVDAYQWADPPWRRQRSNSSSNKESDDEDVAQIACSSQSTVFLTNAGKVYQTGTVHGQILPLPVPIVIPMPLKCVQIAAGRHFLLGRMQGGLAVVSWGAGHFGQLGVGNHSDSSGSSDNSHSQITFTPHPMIVERLLPHMIGTPIQEIAAGDWHALALARSGRVWAWGSNRCHQCGRKPTNSKSSASQAPTITVPLPVPLDVAACQIAAGRSHSVAIARETGQVYCWGSSNHGQCGNAVRRTGIAPPRMVEGLADFTITEIAAGGNHTLALSSHGKVFAWGAGTEGELGTGPPVSSQCKPRQVADLDFSAIAAGQDFKAQQREESGTLEANPSPRSGPVEQPSIVQIYAGASYSAALSSSGHVYTWGSNDAGQIGLPVPTSMPLIDNSGPAPVKTSTSRDLHVTTFDSRHNVLLPTRVDAALSLDVRMLGCGPNHLWCIGQERTAAEQSQAVGRTLYEVQELSRRKKLNRTRIAHHGNAAAADGLSIIDEENAGVKDRQPPVFHELSGSSTFDDLPLNNTRLSEGPTSRNNSSDAGDAMTAQEMAAAAAMSSPMAEESVTSRSSEAAMPTETAATPTTTESPRPTNRRTGLMKRLSDRIIRRRSGSKPAASGVPTDNNKAAEDKPKSRFEGFRGRSRSKRNME